MSRLKLYYIFVGTILLKFLPVHSQCATSEELIYSYDNTEGTSSWHVSFETFVGGSKSAGKSTTGTSFQDSTSSFDLSVGVIAWIIDTSARYFGGKSEHNGNFKTASDIEMLRKDRRYTVSIEVNPGIDVQVFQTVYICGDTKIKTAKVRRVDKKSESMTENDKLESDLASQRLQAELELEIENSRKEILMIETDKAHEIVNILAKGIVQKLRLLNFAVNLAVKKRHDKRKRTEFEVNK